MQRLPHGMGEGSRVGVELQVAFKFKAMCAVRLMKALSCKWIAYSKPRSHRIRAFASFSFRRRCIGDPRVIH
eukprot:scaffold183584_cov28-Tisochrysis_lutea.AAC.1